jgi:tetratricopeptide (TPR) repeat protein
MFERLQPVQKREAGVTANVMLSLIDRMRAEVSSPLPKRYSEFEADAYHVHGHIALAEGTEESARRAVAYFENQLEVNKAIGKAEDIAIAKRSIAIAKSMYGSGNIEELLKASQDLYEIRVAEFGEESGYTIDAGIIYASNLQEANRREEARELLTKLLATSKQVLGPHHKITKEVKMALDRSLKLPITID